MTPGIRSVGVWWVGVALVALLGVASAQDVGVETSIERAAVAEPAEMTEMTPKWLDELKANVAALASLDEAAKKKSGTESLPCITNNLSAARSLLQVSGEAGVALKDALSTGGVERARFEFRKIAIALKKSRSLVAESERCAFGEGIEDGRSQTDLVADAGGSGDDTKGVEDDVMDFGFDPPNASPF
jgi:hypothetical protein